MVETDDRLQGEQDRPRELPARIDIPDIRGEMVYLRPATQQDLEKMDAIDAYVNASGLTGKDRVAERAAVQEALDANPDVVEKLKGGNMKPMGAIIGAVMRATKGQADAKAVTKIVMEKIKG